MTKDPSFPCASDASALPPIIQGGMGVGVSGWRLARAVAQCGQLGVVSGTALDLLLTRQLQLGDLGGHLRRALAHIAARRSDIWITTAGAIYDHVLTLPKGSIPGE